MILSDSEIKLAIESGDIVLSPFSSNSLGSNSYDVHLGDTIGYYRNSEGVLDSAIENEVIYEKIHPQYGAILEPNRLYLGVTQEYTESHRHVPMLEGKSSTGRLGMCIHLTAGVGDVGFCGTWTLEITVVHALKVYAGMPIGQLIWHKVEGKVENPYNKKVGQKYNGQSKLPLGSMMFKNKF